jgi:hypothetical protein
MMQATAVNERLESLTPGQIIAKYQNEAPVDVVALASDLGLNVWSSSLPESVSGKIFRDALNGGKSGFSIVVNSKHAHTRQRFTVAHEIAHFLLHRDVLESGELVENSLYRDGLGGMKESAANRFAADLLMPQPLVRKLIASGIRQPEMLANRLMVSPAAMRIRLGFTA